MTPDELLERVAPPDGGPFVVALSGGPDSAVAAWVVTQLAPDLVRAIHVHHGSVASEELEASAAAAASQLGCALEVVRVEVAGGASWEGRARSLRWEAIEANLRPGETVVTGHHADDLAETVFGHLLRGAGTTGLAAMAAFRAGMWRPLLAVSRRDVAAVAAELSLPHTEDPANRDMAHTRNVIRHQVIPQLEGELSPQLRRVLARTARALAADDAFIEAAIRGGDVVGDAWGAWKLPAPLVTTADPAVAVRLVRRLLRAARPPYAGTAGELEAALDVVHGVTGRRDIADGWQVELEGPWLVVHRGGATEPAPVSCPVPGSARFGALTVVASPSPPVLVRRSSLVRADELGPVVELRAAAPGERIEIAAGSKLVRDVLAEAGIARRIRPAWPVAEAHGRIAAVVGVRTAPWARGAAGEEGVVELSVEEGKF